MSIRKVPFIVGEYYHIYNRGTDKRALFLDNYDYNRFLALLYICNNSDYLNMRNIFNKGKAFVEIFSIKRSNILVDIGVYTLMPNHFHILILEKTESGISKFLQKLSTAYSMYFNNRYERRGSLLEGKFKAKHIDNDPYLNWIFSYIHTNPVKLIEPNWKEGGIFDPVKVKDFIDDYKYSSYYDYFINNRPESTILNKTAFPNNFSHLNSNSFDGLVQNFKENDYVV